MDSFCPVVEGSTVSAHQCLTLGAILRAFLTALLPLLKLGKHKLRVLWRLAVCGTPALGANLFACPHCAHRHWAPRSLWGPALSALPGRQKPPMAPKTNPESPPDPLLPLRLHSTGRT
jgi:hypothetical protein